MRITQAWGRTEAGFHEYLRNYVQLMICHLVVSRRDIMNPSLKELIDVASHLVKKGGEQLGIEDLDQGFRYELLSFMMYLSASDGKIDTSEAKVIEYYTGISASPQAIREHVRKNNIDSAEYKNTVPHIFQAMINVDNDLYKKKIHVEKYTGEIIIEVYIGIANELINADRSVSEIERTDVDVYINNLKKYLNDNLEKMREFSKQL